MLPISTLVWKIYEQEKDVSVRVTEEFQKCVQTAEMRVAILLKDCIMNFSVGHVCQDYT